ncbi:MAG: hypothetical protein HQL20_01620 [Candidatus Omnitrophica bacterium]|nr:hypothetical protein [Candidatus Omnitrophota bacterium]
MKKNAWVLFLLILLIYCSAEGVCAKPPAEGKSSVLADTAQNASLPADTTSSNGQPSVLKEDKAQSNYVYDLKLLIQKSRENIKNVNEKIKDQAVQKRNQQRELKAREYFIQAQKLADEGRLEESRQLYEKAISITEHPEMKYFIKESEHRAKVQKAALSREESDQQRRAEDEEKTAFERVENMYQGAVSLYKQQRFKEARDEFQSVEEVFPDYKAVRSYLQIIEQDIVQSERQGIKNQQKEIEVQQKEAEIARLREKELWRKEVDRKEEDRKKQVQKQAQDVYDEAIRLYQDRKYLAAKEKFQEVEWVVPDFKAVRSYLLRIEKDLESDKSRITEERQKTLEKQRWEETLAKKKSAEELKKSQSLRERQQLEGKKDQAEFVYQSAIALFNKDQYSQARERFDEVEALYPDYRSTGDYLKRIHEMLKDQIAREEGERKTVAEKKIFEEESARRKEEKEKFKQVTEEADTFYSEAFELYKLGRLIEAKDKFLAVDQRVPDYKSTRSYLARIDDDIAAMVAANRKEGDLASQKEQLARLKELRDKADLVYNNAVLAYDNKDFSGAKVKFQEVENIYPNYKKTVTYLSRIDEDIRFQQKASERKESEARVEGIYSQALALYEKDEFAEAKGKFIEVVALIPDYKQTSFYLERIDDDVIRHKQKVIDEVQGRQAEALYNQAVAFYQAGHYVEAKDKFLQLEAVVLNFKDAPKYLANIDADIQRKQQNDEQRAKEAHAEDLYQQALALYKAQDYVAAKEKFVLTEVAYPDYKDTPKYLLSISDDIKRKNAESEQKKRIAEITPWYEQALGLYREQDFEAAKKKFLQVQLSYPGYKDTERYLSRVDEDIRLSQARLAKEEKLSKVDALYSQAMDLYSQARFEEAKVKLQETAALESNYRNIKAYLSRIDNDIRNEKARLARVKLEQQIELVYSDAVELYHAGRLEEARSMFQEVARSLPDYKKNRYYFSRIDEDIRNQKKENARQIAERAEALYREAGVLAIDGEVVKAYQKYSAVEQISPDYKSVRKNLGELKQTLALKGIALPETVLAVAVSEKPLQNGLSGVDEDRLLGLYKEGVALYKEGSYKEARGKFEAVDSLFRDYRSTRKYLALIAAALPEKTAEVVIDVVPVPVAAPAPAPVVEEVVKLVVVESAVKPVMPAAQQQPPVQELKKVEDLSQRSSLLYRQIRALADDKDLAEAAQTFSKIDKIVESLDKEKKRLARTIEQGEKQARERKEAAAKEQAIAAARNEALRQEAVRQKKIDQKDVEDQVHLAAVNKERDDLKRKERERVSQVKELEKETRLKTEVYYQQGLGKMNEKNYVLARERFNDALKIMPRYKDIDNLLVLIDKAEGEQRLIEEEGLDRAKVLTIAEKANAVNSQALALSNSKNFADLQKKFDELSSLLNDIQVIKSHMSSRREAFRAEWEGKLAASRARAAAPRPIKDMKSVIEGRTARQQAEDIYRDAESLYQAGQYAEARVKFKDAFVADPTYKPAYTFALRIDRILERRDFEEQKNQVKKAAREREDKKDGRAPASFPDVVLPDPARAKQVNDEGIALYKAKQYKEARIKFEELVKVGDERQRVKAQRYLSLIEDGLEKARNEAEQARIKEEARYLEAKRLEIRMAWAKDKSLQAQQLTDSAETSQRGQAVAVERQMLLRSIEQENDAQRKRMLADRLRQKDAAERKAFAEWGKVRKLAVHNDVRMDDKTPTIPGKPVEVQYPAAPGKKNKPVAAVKVELKADKAVKEVKVTPPPANNFAKKPEPASSAEMPVNAVVLDIKPAATDVKMETRSRERLAVGSNIGRPLVVTATDSREDRKFKGLIAREKVIESRETERKRLIMEREHQARELENMRQEERKRRAEKEQIRREQRELKEAVKPLSLPPKAPVVKLEEKQEENIPLPVAIPASLPIKALVEVAAPVDVYQVAANEEKRRLEEQRAAIQHDFEVGVESMYNEALALYKKRAYVEAQADFEQVNELVKDYKKTGQYLGLIGKELAKSSYRSKAVAVPAMVSPVQTDERKQSVGQSLDTAEKKAGP